MSGLGTRVDLKHLKKLQRKSPEAFREAQKKAASQFLIWANNSSPKESRKPPIKWGVLRGSASAFVDSELVKVSDGEGTPLQNYTGKPGSITWVWNTPYAARMHEHQGNWGKATMNDKDAGNKWLEKHLQADKEALMQMIAIQFKKEVGM